MVLIRLLILLSLTSPVYADSIGEVTEIEGSGVIKRDAEAFPASASYLVEMLDHVETAKGVVGITFEDNTQVRVSEHSELLIDDFVYDPDQNTGSLGLKVAFGTVKYASGSIANNNSENVNIETPSASISVRGTAFAMTVDEMGGSLIVLLPNEDGSVGEIVVESHIGQVVLNNAFQATSIKNRENIPSKPTTLKIDMNMINNLMIVAPPKMVAEKLIEENIKDGLSENLLDFRELSVNMLDKNELSFNELYINNLNIRLLGNLLTSSFNEGNDGRVAGYNENSGVYTFISEPETRVLRMSENGLVDIVFQTETGIEAEIFQKGSEVYMNTVDPFSTNSIRINQE